MWVASREAVDVHGSTLSLRNKFGTEICDCGYLLRKLDVVETQLCLTYVDPYAHPKGWHFRSYVNTSHVQNPDKEMPL